MAIEKELLDQLLGGRDPNEVFAKGGLLDDLKKALSERILNAELDEHLGDEDAGGNANRRNGYSKKTVLTGTSKMTLSIPRDRAGTFDPKLIAKYQRRFPDFDEKIISMYARGMSVREIRGHLEELYGIDVSPPDLGRHLRGPGRGGRMAEQTARPLLPPRLFRCDPGQDQGGGLRAQQGRLHRAGHPGRRHEGDSGRLDRADRRRQILAARHERAEDPRRRRHPDRRRRRSEGFPRSHQRRLPANGRPDLHRALDPPFARVRVLEGPQDGDASAARNLPRQGRRGRHEGAGRVRGWSVGPALPCDRPELAAQLAARRALLRLSGKRAPDHLHHKRDRGA